MRQEVRQKQLAIRRAMTFGRARAIIAWLLDALSATTTYAEREPRRRVKHKWRPMYGWDLKLAPDTKLLDADGKPTRVKIAKIFTHKPGDIITSDNGKKYMVRPDQSLRLCTT
jgi:hypothetical protein